MPDYRFESRLRAELKATFDDLRNVIELLPKERADIRWYPEGL
jgi:hypothetical protein